MDSAVQWLWRVTGRKKDYVLALTLIQDVTGGLGVLCALLLQTDLRPLHNLRALTDKTVVIVTNVEWRCPSVTASCALRRRASRRPQVRARFELHSLSSQDGRGCPIAKTLSSLERGTPR
jgi:hypothetical protein